MKKVLGFTMLGIVVMGIAFGVPALRGSAMWFIHGLIIIGACTVIVAVLTLAGWLIGSDDENTK